MGKAKTTLDTNILISAFGWKGKPMQVLAMAVEGKFELVTSDKQFNELERVLDYPKFRFTEKQKKRFKALILSVATLVKPKEKINAIKEDPDDNMILECGVAGKVDYIVTGDPDLLKLKEFRGIKIRTAKEFLKEGRKDNTKELFQRFLNRPRVDFGKDFLNEIDTTM
ncbi:putative toxin-antitoxin system toxin component, PIN family [Candidatus Woesearchaeota archaeon]|nr:putative toxin-antitoxin system toxin component, PIN family [Candidatus Woesearchaeota archaeon]